MDNLQYYFSIMLPGQKVGFKPYYKWITFNTNPDMEIPAEVDLKVLNLIING